MALVRAVPLALGILLCGCLEHQVQTTVYLDGSCDRMVMLPADSMVVPSTPFPLNVAAGWDTSWRPAKGGKGFVLVLTKHFARPEELAAEYGPPATAADSMWRWKSGVVPLVLHVLPVPGGVPPAEPVHQGFPRRRYSRRRGLQVCARRAEQPVESEGGDLGRQESVRDPGRYAQSRPAGGGDRPGAASLEEKKELLFEAMVKIGPTARSGTSAT